MTHHIIKSFAVLMAACLPAVASAQYFEVGGIVYGITSGQTVEVQPYYNLLNNPYSGAVKIPQTVEWRLHIHRNGISRIGLRRLRQCQQPDASSDRPQHRLVLLLQL